ncbi:type I restriction endonuclease subunit R [Dictyobacter aurantiacus]|uniref:Type I restriction enzyme endonuclease subunit n=1 Tax=Dictyobacter aurantiacus TaxID=1936993 RepID=A0A401ZD24_9CHLR|nr:type I restriction endonuclease subunit R [Dictyobacter aurantiacus]GCE04790.1 DEAD/DEAH box helicase [Dictyobacter aurantiacus]
MRENSEDQLVEQPAIALFDELGYETVNAYREKWGEKGTLGRETMAEVVLVPRLRLALQKLNPGASSSGLELAIEELTCSRSDLSLIQANHEIYRLLKQGVKVTVTNDDDEEVEETIRVIDWGTPSNNDFLLVSQMWITGQIYKRRTDLVGFVNGLPLVFCEFKASHKRIEDAYNNNLRDYKSAIPQLFWYNALLILSNGTYSRIGSITASWEHFFEWKKVSSEDEEGAISLETIIRGTCDPIRLLDLVENFTLFSDASGDLRKIIAKNHQYLGVNNALGAVRDIRHNQGRLGVFWHTQGSGKSLSMVFFSEKVRRKIDGNWTFVIVTDREDLDNQIYKTFASAGVLTEPEDQVHAESGEHLKQLLRADHRTVFTLIQKFNTKQGETYPELSQRSDIIVITDEAHRSQYDTLARNMRTALPKAAFLGFTGTPLMAEGEEETREVFGDYVSVYNFRQSIEDGVTVPLYYENRIPELQLVNATFNDDMEQVIEAAGLDEQQEKRLEREFSREYHLFTNNDRLEKIAQDIVRHFMERGQQGKAMVVSIDKMTAVRMYDKVQTHWWRYRDNLQKQLTDCSDDIQRKVLSNQIAYMNETDMAVVVSQGQNEIEDFKKKGLDILPHRQRMVRDNLEQKFKDPDNSLRIVFVCAMWMTGFDVPSLSTVYLDKPMRNHTLMQTIARANRVFKDKVNGLIVDYVGVFRNLQKALAIYGSGSGGGVQEGDTPVQDKDELVEQLKQALAELIAFCHDQGCDPLAIVASHGFQRIKLLKDAEDVLVSSDESKQRFIALTRNVIKLYKATLPHTMANDYAALVDILNVLLARIKLDSNPADISAVMKEVEDLVGSSIATREYIIQEAKSEDDRYLNLSGIDFDALRQKFETAHKHIEVEKLRSSINNKLKTMVKLNKSRINYQEKFQHLIDEYNTGSMNVDILYQQLLNFVAEDLNVEDQRHIAEQLSEEELAVFDLLTQDDVKLSDDEKAQVKKLTRTLLETLKKEKLVLDWRKKQQTRAAVKLTVETLLDNLLPAAYNNEAYQKQCDNIYQHIYDSYYGPGQSIYTKVG